MTPFFSIYRPAHWGTALLTLVAAVFVVLQPAQAERIKDIGSFAGLRTNQLVGYGVVVGLAGTGDDSLEYATVGLKGVTNRFGLTLPPGVNPASKNAAAVLVTAEMPAFAKPGQRQGKILARRHIDPDAAIWCRSADIRDGPGKSGCRRSGCICR